MFSISLPLLNKYKTFSLILQYIRMSHLASPHIHVHTPQLRWGDPKPVERSQVPHGEHTAQQAGLLVPPRRRGYILGQQDHLAALAQACHNLQVLHQRLVWIASNSSKTAGAHEICLVGSEHLAHV